MVLRCGLRPHVTDRQAAAAQFLSSAGWGDAKRIALAGDASSRRYERVQVGEASAILMDARPAHGESTWPFTRMAKWLIGRGFSAPALLAADHTSGFLLLEDLGDALLARLVEAEPARETMLYSATTDFLVDLHRHDTPDFVTHLNGPALAELVRLTPRWYLPGVNATENSAASALPDLIEAHYGKLAGAVQVTCLRDFHAENLIWLPERSGTARLGLLDFQDAVVAHPAYDLVSLLQDARRDLAPQTEAAMIARYTAATGVDADQFMAAYALLGAQRALRLLGVFTRLTLHYGKPNYLAFMPRVWHSLNRNLAHPDLTDLADAVAQGLPEPTEERIERIKAQCGRHPTP